MNNQAYIKSANDNDNDGGGGSGSDHHPHLHPHQHCHSHQPNSVANNRHQHDHNHNNYNTNNNHSYEEHWSLFAATNDNNVDINVDQNERLPINIRRPILYTDNFFPLNNSNTEIGGDHHPHLPHQHHDCYHQQQRYHYHQRHHQYTYHQLKGQQQQQQQSTSSRRPLINDDGLSKSSSSTVSLIPEVDQSIGTFRCCGVCGGGGNGGWWTRSKNVIQQRLQTMHTMSMLTTILPILGWLPNYNVRRDLFADIITGVTILALHIPQGLAYGKLAGVEPINGLYVSLFPVIIYALFGSSRQISIGTFAVISIACKDVLNDLEGDNLYVPNNIIIKPTQTNGTVIDMTDNPLNGMSAVDILSSLCLMVGLVQFFIGILRLGILSTLLSDSIISSFVVACSFYVFVSQVFPLFGVSSTPDQHEPAIPFDLIRDIWRLLRRLPTQANWATIMLSMFTISMLVFCKYCFEPMLIERYRLRNVTIPIDIIMIVLLTLLSYAFDLNDHFGVAVIPKISASFEHLPTVPRFNLEIFRTLLTASVLIAFIAYCTTYTLGKVFADKHQYEVYANQELIALGLSNVFSSFFLCFPSSGSLARSTVQEKVGGRTQLASLLSSGLIVIFILYFSPYLATLPNCVLSCIIIVALISTMHKFVEVFDYWRVSKLDGIAWIVNFVLVLLLGVATGLIYGLVINLALLLLRMAMPRLNFKYHLPNTECYLPIVRTSNMDATINACSDDDNDGFGDGGDDRHLCTSVNTIQSTYSGIPGVIIFEFYGPLMFLNVEQVKRIFVEKILTPQAELKHKIIQINDDNDNDEDDENEEKDKEKDEEEEEEEEEEDKGEKEKNGKNYTKKIIPVHSVIFDFAHINYIDKKATELLCELQNELQHLSIVQHRPIRLLLAINDMHIIDTLQKCKFFKNFNHKQCFLTVHDAVMAATASVYVAKNCN